MYYDSDYNNDEKMLKLVLSIGYFKGFEAILRIAENVDYIHNLFFSPNGDI